jgi:hypothetical protein
MPLAETSAMPAVRKPSFMSKIPRKFRKYVVQGVGLAAGVSMLFYFIFVAVAFMALDGAVTKLTSPEKGKEGIAELPKKPPLHLVYLTKDFNGISVIRPQRIFKSSMFADVPFDEVTKPMIEETGIDPRKIDLVVYYNEPWPGGRPKLSGGPEIPNGKPITPFYFGVVLHFTDAVDGKAIITKILSSKEGTFSNGKFEEKTIPPEEAEYQGKSYLRTKPRPTPAGMPRRDAEIAGKVVDDQTILLGMEPTLQKMLTVEGEVTSPLKEHLDMLDPESLESSVFVLEPYAEMISQGMTAMKANFAQTKLPPAMKPVLDIPERIKVLSSSFDLERETMMKVTAVTGEASAADESQKALKQSLDALKGLYAFAKGNLEMTLPPNIKDETMKSVDSLVDGIKVEADGKNIVFTVKRPDGLEDLIKKGGPMMKGMIGQRAEKTFTEVGDRIGDGGPPPILQKQVRVAPGAIQTYTIDASPGPKVVEVSLTSDAPVDVYIVTEKEAQTALETASAPKSAFVQRRFLRGRAILRATVPPGTGYALVLLNSGKVPANVSATLTAR